MKTWIVVAWTGAAVTLLLTDMARATSFFLITLIVLCALLVFAAQ